SASHHRRDQRVLFQPGRFELAGDPSAAEDEAAIGQPDHFLRVRGDEQNAASARTRSSIQRWMVSLVRRIEWLGRSVTAVPVA
ncbi:MAG: hypothetical protein WA746_22425, partial [Isosphaeraceae bacterium]